MAPFGKIWSYIPSPRVMRIQAAANLNGLELTFPDFVMRETNRTPEFLAKFPYGKVPTFEGTDGINLFETDAIAEYVALSGPAAEQLMGSTLVERATIRQWICFSQGEVMENVIQLALWRRGAKPYDEAVENNALERLERSLAFLDSHLKDRTWVCSEDKISMADITLASALAWGFSMAIDAEMRSRCPVTIAWYERVITVDGVNQAFGEKKFIEKRQVPQD
ncbi:glutathione S-transferase [Aspergillus caelatus]|uniref:Glutathione S-transferase n=1 Tax=Aspergillus caelatus TaxID=61420 RepID=A0A5N6ZP68_9EURO|nr:glutathione S-transferase [Aspergillus caelatus]KAE8359235.1 glutathione S-transferase [Aspergillus caelatus]